MVEIGISGSRAGKTEHLPHLSLGTVDERLLVARTCDIPAPMYVQLPVSGVQCL